jgi:hypothetical protein
VPLLTKTSLLQGLRCPKALWLATFRPDLASDPRPSDVAIRDEGREVERLARGLWPDGVVVEATDLGSAVVGTRELLAAGERVLFEAAFEHAGLAVRVDVLVRDPASGAVHLVEVKASLQPKEEHLHDVAIQRHVLAGNGLAVERASLLLLDPTYERRGPLDLPRLFAFHDVTADTAPADHGVAADAQALARVFDLREAPPLEIGAHCRSPWPCSFVPHCWAGIPPWSIYDLWGVPEATLAALRARGILTPDRVPPDVDLPPKARAIVETAREGRELVDVEALRGFLAQVRWPVHVLDFETVGPAIPPFDGTRAYDVIPFQWSLRVQETPGGPSVHRTWLADGRGDYRAEVAATLRAAVGPEGSVLSWTAYEARCLERLAAWSDPESAAGLAGVASRLVDLATPFRERWVRLPGARGSYSLKQVLPALAPELSFADLALRDGLAAVRAFERLSDPATPPDEAALLRSDLERYCGRDTEGALRVLEALRARAAAPVA